MSDDLTPQGAAAVRLALLVPGLRAEVAEAQAVIEKVRALADDLREYNPGHGDYCRAGLLIHEALDPEAAS